MIIELVVGVLVFVAVFKVWVDLTLWRKMPPGPSGFPVLGYLPLLDKEAPYLTLSNLVSKYGRVFSIKLGQVKCVVLADPDLIRKCFSKLEFCNRAPLFLTHGIMDGYGLICAEGPMWKIHRQLLAEFMRSGGLKKANSSGKSHLEDKFMACVRRFLSRLDSWTVDDNLSDTIGNMMNEIIFGVSYDENDPTWVKLKTLRAEGIKAVSVAGPLNFLSWLRHFPRFRDTLRWIKEGKRISHLEYEKLSRQSSAHDETITATFLKGKASVKAEFADSFFSDTQLYHLQADVFGAGTDTSLTTIKWCILYLCKYQEDQSRIRKEIAQHLGNAEDVTLAHMSDLHFTQAFLAEVQRLRPVVPLGVPHGTTRTIELGQWTLPKDCMIIPLHWHMNHDPQLWSDPDSFEPERFLDPKDGTCHVPSHLMPFQVGRRRCIGEDFGRAIVFLFVTNLIKSYKVALADDCQDYDLNQIPDHGFTLTPKPFSLMVTRY